MKEDDGSDEPEEIVKSEVSPASFNFPGTNSLERISGTSLTTLSSNATLLNYPEGLTIGTPSSYSNLQTGESKEFKKSTLSSDR